MKNVPRHGAISLFSHITRYIFVGLTLASLILASFETRWWLVIAAMASSALIASTISGRIILLPSRFGKGHPPKG